TRSAPPPRPWRRAPSPSAVCSSSPPPTATPWTTCCRTPRSPTWWAASTPSPCRTRRRGTQKTVLERKAPPTFNVLIEIQDKDRLAVHDDVAEVVDRFLRDVPPRPELRTRTAEGGVEIRKSERQEMKRPETPWGDSRSSSSRRG